VADGRSRAPVAARHLVHPGPAATPATPLSAPAPPDELPPRVVELVPTPKAVRVALDGQDLGDFGPALARLELAAGAHTITFASPFCFPKSVPIAANEAPGRLTARLKWKPATLTVHAAPESADVLVDGSVLGRNDMPIPITIPELSPDGKRVVSVKVSAPGHASEELEVVLRANESKLQSVTLRPMGAP
jgi:hypothetical protein